MKKMMSWKLKYKGFDPDQERLREALCTLGNGYFASRGAGEESSTAEDHYPGTYLSGGYNRLRSVIAGRTIENEDLVNWQNWLPLTFCAGDGGRWFKLEETEIIHYTQTLNIQEGTLERDIHFRDNSGRESRIQSQRLVSMDDPHKAAISWILTPINWSGKILIRSALDGSVKNEGVARYSKLSNHHLKIIEKGVKNESFIYLLTQTNQSRIYMAQVARCRIFRDGQPVPAAVRYEEDAEQIAEIATLQVDQNKSIKVEKTLVLYTSRDFGISEPLMDALADIQHAERFDELLGRHRNAWRRIWYRFDITVKVKGNTQLLLRLHIFHLLQTCSMHTIGLDTGVPARGLHGEAYRGHIFWDEIFIFPLLNLRMPDLTRSLLLYRYNRLNAARRLAAKEGFRGAMFPWQSGSNGREESQEIHLNPKSGQWVPDHTYLQRHVNLAIAYNIWQYYEVSRDTGFMKFYGAEMLLEIAQFFASISTWNKDKERYEILKVVGPDEFHTAYPGSHEPGINNNAYTNVLTSWLLTHTLKALDLLDKHRSVELLQKLGIDNEEVMKWNEISRKLFIPFTGKNIITQFEGYENLKEFDWEGYRRKYDDIQRLDRILDAEGDSVNNYKASKQADVLMLFYLFSAPELMQLFKRLGYEFAPAQIPENIKYYLSRTSDGSTLSHIVRSWVEARSDRQRAWHSLRQALHIDMMDVQGGTTQEGIHVGSMAGTVDILLRCFTGLEIRENALWINPQFPKEIETLKMRVYYNGVWLDMKFQQRECTIEAKNGKGPPVILGFKNQTFEIKPRSTYVIDFNTGAGFLK